MKRALGRIREIVEKHDLIALVTSIFSLVLGLISFIQAGLSFDWMHVSVGCFYVLFGLGSILLRFTRLPERCHPYLLGAITILLCLGPMGVGLYLLVSRARGFALFYDWIAYLYALFAFIKVGFAIAGLVKRDEKKEIVRVNLWMGMISAIFTISLLANHLVEMTASKSTGRMDDMLIILQVATVLLAAAVLIYFVIAYIRTKRI